MKCSKTLTMDHSPGHILIDRPMNDQAQAALERIAKIDIFDETCEGHQALEKITNKWTVLIIYALIQGKKRYSELQRQIKGISPKMLIQNLRNLERCGLVQRTVYPIVPPQVERECGSPHSQRSGMGKDSTAMERSGIAN